MRKILAVYGTRPEAIKMAPLIEALAKSEHCRPIVAVTGQHRDMLDQVNRLFKIRPDYDLNIITTTQTLQQITSRVLDGVSRIIDQVGPDALVVQGDTSTCMGSALAGFYCKVPVVHLEAGLRTGDPHNPFPEEINRRLATQMATLHLAPTGTSRDNLLKEGITAKDIVVTGNTVIDSLLQVSNRASSVGHAAIESIRGRRSVLVTAHRRESWGEPMAQSARAIARLSRMFPDVAFLLPAHLNPKVQDVLLPPLRGLDNVIITQPLDYCDFVDAMRACSIVLTDSGGVQEEAPTFGKPVLVMRETTERPEAVAAGTVRLVGTDEDRIVDGVATLLTDPSAYRSMALAVNPYGDGRAAERSVAAIEHLFGLAERPAEFGMGEERHPSVGTDVRGFAA